MKTGYNRFGVFAVSIGLMLCLTVQAWLPAWAHKFGEFPGKGDKTTWMKANYYKAEAKKLREAGSFDKAIPLYSKAIAMYSEDASYFFGRGLSFEARRKTGDLSAAEKDFLKASELAPEEWQVWECIGHVFYEQGRKKECIPMFLKAIGCNPPATSKERIEKNLQEVKTELARVSR